MLPYVFNLQIVNKSGNESSVHQMENFIITHLSVIRFPVIIIIIT
jgi:hypothetical protein